MSYWLLCSSGRSCSCALPLRTLLSSADRARASCQCVCHRSLLSVHRGQCGGDGAEVSPRTSDLWGVYFDLAGPLCQLLLSALPRPSEQPRARLLGPDRKCCERCRFYTCVRACGKGSLFDDQSSVCWFVLYTYYTYCLLMSVSVQQCRAVPSCCAELLCRAAAVCVH